MPKAKRVTKKTPAPMPEAAKTASSKAASAAAAKKKKQATKRMHPLIRKRPRNFGIGNNIQPKRDVTRFVRWPRYIKLQRQKRVLFKRLKVPPAIHQFSCTANKNTSSQVLTLLNKYRPEAPSEKKTRLMEVAKAKAADPNAKVEPGKKPMFVKYGINHVTALIEQKKAKLVVIAHDVDPIEIVVWLPSLCRKMGVPYCIIKGKSRLGEVVRQKTATAVALTAVRPEDSNTLAQLVEALNEKFLNNGDSLKKVWGAQSFGIKSNHARIAKERAVAHEERQRVAALANLKK